jgi:hypothetical protein
MCLLLDVPLAYMGDHAASPWSQKLGLHNSMHKVSEAAIIVASVLVSNMIKRRRTPLDRLILATFIFIHPNMNFK